MGREKLNSFAAIAKHLDKLRMAFGEQYRVAYMWDGGQLTVMCHREGLEGPFQMIFDSEDDYKMSDEKITELFVNNAEDWFSKQRNEK